VPVPWFVTGGRRRPDRDMGRTAVLTWNLGQRTATSGALCLLRAGRGAAVRTEDRIATAAAGRGRLRASDSDRERVLDILKTAFVQGRLTKDELDVRVGQTLASRTWGDLTAVTDDIPAWPIPRTVRKPAGPPSSPPVPAFIKAVACAVIALATVSVAGMPGMWTMPTPPPPSMTAQACQTFYSWRNPNSNFGGSYLLYGAVTTAKSGSDPVLASDLTTLQRAYLRYQGVGGRPFSAAAASQLRAATAQVTSDCQVDGY
jgi:hypothetical protein